MLLAEHQKLIDGSAISAAIADTRGYESVTTKARLQQAGFSRSQSSVPGLLAPIWDHGGEVVTYHYRPDQPRIKNGRALKYETPTGSRMAVDVPPTIRGELANPAVPLLITEGVRKADSAVSAGLCCVALMGTWCWRGTNPDGGKTLLADFEAIAFNGRRVYVVFDSDVMTKTSVHAAVERLVPVLRNRGAHVSIVYLPDGPGGEKVGLDDFLAAGSSPDDLLALAEPRLRPLGSENGDPRDIPYSTDEHGIVWNSASPSGTKRTRIANFRAQIVADRELRDGAEVVRSFEIEAQVRGRSVRLQTSIQQFKDGSWVLEQLGGEAILEAVPRAADHLAAGIQHLSVDIPKIVIYGHTGWVQLDGEWIYLSSSGGIGVDGTIDVEIELPDGLRGFSLPEPPHGSALVEAVRASLKLLELGPPPVMFALLATIYRAPLGSSDLTTFIVGQTGSLKTAVAAVAQQHFGAELDAQHLPLSFTDTANSLEGQLFLLKDVLAVIDDFAPGGTRTDVQRSHRDADRVFRSAANRQGRRRMRADTTIRPAKPPRAAILATGEDLPQGHSLRARTYAIQTDPGMIDAERLTELQHAAADGTLSAAMAGYVQYLARAYTTVRDGLKEELADLRVIARGRTAHRRSVDGAASLLLGLWYFLEYAETSGAIDDTQRLDLWERGTAAILTGVEGQEQHHQDADPVARFIGLLNSALATGTAHVADGQGHQPLDPGAWGWRDGEPQGRRIGWISDDNLYLDRDGAYAAVQRLANESGEALPITASTLSKRLHEHGLLASTEQRGRQTLTVRRKLEDARRSVLHLRSSALRPASDRVGEATALTPSTTDLTSSTTDLTTATSYLTPPLSAASAQDTPAGQVGQSGQGANEKGLSARRVPELPFDAKPLPSLTPARPDQLDPSPIVLDSISQAHPEGPNAKAE
jgi:hypothetical protein